MAQQFGFRPEDIYGQARGPYAQQWSGAMPASQDPRTQLWLNGASRQGFGGLGLNLSRKQRGLLRGASSQGQLAELLQARQGIARKLARANEGTQAKLAQQLGVDPSLLPRYAGDPGAGFGTGGYGFSAGARAALREAAANGSVQNLLQNRLQLAGNIRSMSEDQRKQLAALLRIDPSQLSGVPPAPGTPENPLPEDKTNLKNTTGNTGVVGPTPANEPTVSDTISMYQTKPLDSTTALNNFYTQGLSRMNAAPQASYQDMFKNYQDLATQEAERQAAAINESFGSRGARYSTDLLRGQEELRARMAAEGRVAADQFGLKLNEQRIGEQNALATGALGLAEDEARRKKMAQDLFIMDYLRKTGAPPLLEAASQTSASYGNPGTVVY